MRRIVVYVILAVILFGPSAMAVEEPPFKTVLHEGSFEIRDYPALVVAEVVVTGGQTSAASKGFRLLANYIFGGNTTQDTLPMTAPVTQSVAGGAWMVRFFMPTGATLASLPTPKDAAVKLVALPPGRMAVLRFSGWVLGHTLADKSAALESLLRSHDLVATGPITLAQYNPPWTPWFMRRNEVMIPIKT